MFYLKKKFIYFDCNSFKIKTKFLIAEIKSLLTSQLFLLSSPTKVKSIKLA